MVTDETRGKKLMYQGGDLIPRVAVLDPRMTISLPPSLTASTGIDALTHAVEPMHTTWHQPLTDGLAVQAMRLISDFLLRAFGDGSDLEARLNMLLAADMAGIAAANSYIGIVHAVAHPLGAMFHVPHGVATGVMLPWGMEMNLNYEGIPAIYRRVASALGLSVDDDDDMTASRKGIEWIRELIAGLSLPGRLRDIGVPEDSLGALADETMEDRSMYVTPGLPGRDEVLELLRRAY
jgi:alcohol dehydrogenase class IV